MQSPGGSKKVWRFGIFEVDPRAAELRRNGIPVKTRDQSFRILIHLLEHAGELVSREELRRVLWPADTFVDFEHSLNTAVMKLREALGDSADLPLYIETVPKRGYRFIAPVSQSPVSSPMLAPAIEAPAPSVGVGRSEHGSAATSVFTAARFRRVAGLTGLIFLVVAVSTVFFRSRRALSRSASPETSIQRIVPVTSSAGNALNPVFSPDGREIAFIWDGPERARYDLYVQLVGAEKPLRLTYSKAGIIGAPGWSPDGSQIGFSRCDGKSDGVFVVPALGGEERKLTSVGCYSTVPGTVIWTHDGSGILMMDRCSDGGALDIVLFSLATGQKRCITDQAPATGSDAGFGFALSPDGATIAYTTTTAARDIWTIPLPGGARRHIASDVRLGCSTLTDCGLMWTPDGTSIVFVSKRTALPSLWRVATRGAEVERETVYPAIGSFSKDGKSFVYSEKRSVDFPSIWRANLAAPGGAVLSNSKLIGSQYSEMDAQPSPDGARIVWLSIRTAFTELWTSDDAGAEPVQLTHLDRYSGTPRWSPDSTWVVFDSITEHKSQVFVIDSEGRNLHAITSGDADNAVPSWSRDGTSIYFASRRTGNWQVWRHSLVTGAESQLTTNGGFDPFESFDGQTVYFTRFFQAGLWSIPASGGTETLVVADKPQAGYWGHWAVTRQGIYLLDTEAEPRPGVEFYSFASRRTSPVFTMQQQPVPLQPSLSATADGMSVFYTQYDRQSVITLIEFAQ